MFFYILSARKFKLLLMEIDKNFWCYLKCENKFNFSLFLNYFKSTPWWWWSGRVSLPAVGSCPNGVKMWPVSICLLSLIAPMRQKLARIPEVLCQVHSCLLCYQLRRNLSITNKLSSDNKTSRLMWVQKKIVMKDKEINVQLEVSNVQR